MTFYAHVTEGKKCPNKTVFYGGLFSRTKARRKGGDKENAMRKIMMTALALLCAGLVMPTVASATPPVVDAGPDEEMLIHSSLRLQATATDADFDPIIGYQWDVESAPSGSNPVLDSPKLQSTYFSADLPGEYVVSVVAYDSFETSQPDYVTVTVYEVVPPVAIPSSDITTGPGPLIINFDGLASTVDPDAGPLTYAWTFGDGSSASGPEASHTYDASGTFNAKLTVADRFGQLDTDYIVITVTSSTYGNRPVVKAGPDQEIQVNDLTALVGSATDADLDPIVAWRWTVEQMPYGSSPYLATPMHSATQFVPDMPGEYVVSVVVRDMFDWSEPDYVTISVYGTVDEILPPIAMASSDVTAGQGPLTVSFDGSASIVDPDAGLLTYDWTFGDGNSASGAVATHTYDSLGTFTATLTVVDSNGGFDTDVVVINVLSPQNNRPIVNAGWDQEIQLGSFGTLVGSATDADLDPIVAWRWTIEQAPDGSAPELVTPTQSVTRFNPDMPGEYVVSLVAGDMFDWSEPDYVLISVHGVAPVAIATSDVAAGDNPLTVNFDGSASTVDSQAGPLAFVWDFGDGSSASGPVATHTYLWPGTYTANLTVVDSSGQLDIEYIVITVTPSGNIQVSPEAYDFGDVELGSSSSSLISVIDPPDGRPLELLNISLAAGGSNGFEITVDPSGATILPGDSVDVEVVFTPTAEGYVTNMLQITSDDPAFPSIEIPLGGVGVLNEQPPEAYIAAIRQFLNDAVADGAITGEGSGNSAEKRINALGNMLDAVGDLILAGEYELAYNQLESIYRKIDGQSNPPDFVSGPGVAELAQQVEALLDALASVLE
jgi:PKD repeat protein